MLQELSDYLRLQKSKSVEFASFLENNKLKSEIKAMLTSVAGRGRSNVSRYMKVVNDVFRVHEESITECMTIIREAMWLYDKFGEGEYQDIAGLCKLASREEIAEKNYSLTPGAYVGVAAVEDDGVDFAQRMGEIHKELLALQAESNELMQTISKNMEEIGV